MTRPAGAPAVAMAVCLGLLAVAAWRWQAAVQSREPAGLAADDWTDARQRFAMPPERQEQPTLEPEVYETVVRANPFSPMRRAVPLPREEPGSDRADQRAEERQPELVYKGRIALGAKERAIIENLATKKTHFLELGQEVAGFKVLDIEENRVVLSDGRTNAEVVLSVTSTAKP